MKLLSAQLNATTQSYLIIVLVFIVWRLLLLILGLYADDFLAYQPSFPYAYSILPLTGLPRWLYSWANFDGVHYLTIITKGYWGTGLIQAFFPFFPLLVRSFAGSSFSLAIIWGIIISNVSFLVSLFVMFDTVKSRGVRQAWITLGLLLLFPTSFFFAAVYTESLFLLVAVLGWRAMQQQKWELMGIWWSIASATRLVGIFLPFVGLVYLVEQTVKSTQVSTKLKLFDMFLLWLRSKLIKTEHRILVNVAYVLMSMHRVRTALHTTLRQQKRAILYLVVSGFGLLGYMIYLYQTYQDPLYFFHVQREFGGGREESIILLPQVVWRYIKMIATYQAIDWRYYSILQEFILTSLAYAALVVFRKRLSTAEILYCILALTLPTLTGTFASMPRYILVCFPLFWATAAWLSNKPKLTWLVLLSMFTLMLINTVLFIQGYWIA